MNPVSRRAVLKAGALGGAALAAPVGAARLRSAGKTLVIYDSRVPESAAFADAWPGAVTLDLAAEHGARFATLRAGAARGVRVEALTRWSDFVATRGELARHGLRLMAASPAPAPLSRVHGLQRWSMLPR